MVTKMLHLSQVTIQPGSPESLADSIKPELFVGKHEARLEALCGITQFDLHMRSRHYEASEFGRRSTRASDGTEHTPPGSARVGCPLRSA